MLAARIESRQQHRSLASGFGRSLRIQRDSSGSRTESIDPCRWQESRSILTVIRVQLLTAAVGIALPRWIGDICNPPEWLLQASGTTPLFCEKVPPT